MSEFSENFIWRMDQNEEPKTRSEVENLATSLNNDGNDAKVTFDDVLKLSGEFGPFQKILYLFYSIPYVETAMQVSTS